MNGKQSWLKPQGREPDPAAPPPPPMKYRLPQDVSLVDESIYHACHRLQVMIPQRCKNNCDKCLYRNSFRVCITNIAREIMKNIEKKYDIEAAYEQPLLSGVNHV
jgi:hypothetical protein